MVPEMSFTEMKVPRRPHWDATTTPEELNRREKESFMNWRRDIAMYVSFFLIVGNEAIVVQRGV